MKLRSLFITMLIIFAMVLGSVVAQDMPTDSCMNLSADDCAVITAAEANGIGDAKSFTIEVNISLDASGIPDDTMSSFSFSVDGAINFSQDMASMIPVNVGGSLDIASDQLPDTMTLEFALVGDVAYFTDPTTGEWSSIDLATLMQSDQFSQIIQDAMSGNTDTGSTAMSGIPNISDYMPLLGVLDLPGLLNYERNGDDFVFTIDLSTLKSLNDPANADLLASIDKALTDADPSLQGMAMMIPTFIQDGKIVVTQTVDTDLNIVNNIAIDANVDIAMGATPTTVNLHMNFAITNLDSAPTAEAPADATDITDMVTSMITSLTATGGQ